MKKLKKILKNERGQGMLEYVLILAVVIAIGMIFKDKIMTAIRGKTEGVANDISGFSAQ